MRTAASFVLLAGGIETSRIQVGAGAITGLSEAAAVCTGTLAIAKAIARRCLMTAAALFLFGPGYQLARAVQRARHDQRDSRVYTCRLLQDERASLA